MRTRTGEDFGEMALVEEEQRETLALYSTGQLGGTVVPQGSRRSRSRSKRLFCSLSLSLYYGRLG